MYDKTKKRWFNWHSKRVHQNTLASELLAEEVEADLFVIATDVKGVFWIGESRSSACWKKSLPVI